MFLFVACLDGMGQILVTVGSDGFTDWVKLPDGSKRTLGTVSVLKFVVDLAPKAYVARSVLDQFLKSGSAMFTVDVDRMEGLLKPRRSRWAADSPLISGQDRSLLTEPTRQGEIMADTADGIQAEAIKNQITQIEEQIGLFQQKAKEAGPNSLSADMMNSQIESLKKLISDLKSPSPYGDQADNSDFYPSGEDAKMASFDAFKANSELAEVIVAKVGEADQKIDRLVQAGRKFDVTRAKGDLYKIATKVAEIAESVDLAEPWIRGDLQKLATEAARIHKLFASAKV